MVLLVRGRREVQPELTFPCGNPSAGSPTFVGDSSRYLRCTSDRRKTPSPLTGRDLRPFRTRCRGFGGSSPCPETGKCGAGAWELHWGYWGAVRKLLSDGTATAAVSNVSPLSLSAASEKPSWGSKTPALRNVTWGFCIARPV